MAAPNIANTTTITGKTAVQSVGTSLTAIVTNAVASGLVYKINSLVVSNIDGTNSADISVSLQRSATDYYIAKTVAVPADSSLVVIEKGSTVWLEEGDAIFCLASAAGDLQAVCSYEIIT
tara:strand:- start:82198 stop:82557 length:360 start_codon:yes stop_codon:yes gene_type:complete